VLPKVHIVVANLKMWLRGTYNCLPAKHLQRYLDEFVFRFKRGVKNPQSIKNIRTILLQMLYYHIDNITDGGDYETKRTKTFPTNVSLF